MWGSSRSTTACGRFEPTAGRGPTGCCVPRATCSLPRWTSARRSRRCHHIRARSLLVLLPRWPTKRSIFFGASHLPCRDISCSGSASAIRGGGPHLSVTAGQRRRGAAPLPDSWVAPSRARRHGPQAARARRVALRVTPALLSVLDVKARQLLWRPAPAPPRTASYPPTRIADACRLLIR